MSEYFDIKKIMLSDSRYPNYSEGFYCDDTVNSIYASLSIGLLEVIVRSHIDPTLSRSVHSKFLKALALKTNYSENEYFVEAYPIIENLVNILNRREYNFSQVSEWFTGYIMPGEYCTNHKLIYVFKNMLLGFVKDNEIKSKIESQVQLSDNDIENLAKEVADYFEVSIRILKGCQVRSYSNESSFGYLPLILTEDCGGSTFMWLRPVISEKFFSIETHEFLLVNNDKKSLKIMQSHQSSQKNSLLHDDQGSSYRTNTNFSKSIDIVSSKNEPRVINPEKKTNLKNYEEVTDKAIAGFTYTLKNRPMIKIQRSQQINIIKGTDNRIIEMSRIIFQGIESRNNAPNNENKEVEKMIELVSLILNENIQSLPAEAINHISNMKDKELLFEKVPSLKRYFHTETSYKCIRCQKLNNSEDYETFSCSPKCIICFSCRKRYSTIRCESCGREYSNYEKYIFNTLGHN